MPESALYLSDMGGFPRAGEPILMHPSGKIAVGISIEELSRLSGDDSYRSYYRSDNPIGGVVHVVENASALGTLAYTGFTFRCAGVEMGYVHATGPAYTNAGLLFTSNAYYIYGTASTANGTWVGTTHASAKLAFFTGGSALTNERLRIISTGHIAVMGTSGSGFTPAAYLHFAAGSTAAGNLPIRLTSGSLNTTAVAGGIEFLTDKIYFTITTSAARKELTLNDIALTSTRVPFVTTNGRLTDNAFWTYVAPNVTFSNTANSPTQVIANTISGTGAYAMFMVQSAGAQAGFLSATGAGWTAAGIYLASQANVGGSLSGGLNIVAEHASGVIRLVTGGTATTNERAQIDAAGNKRFCGTAALSTSATDGFVYLPTSAGAPSGTPTAVTGGVAFEYDTTNDKLMVYNGSWRGIVLT